MPGSPSLPAGTWNRATGTGGANGSFRFASERAGAPNNNNANMNAAHRAVVAWQTAVNAQLAANPGVPPGTRASYADCLHAAGVIVAIAAGGPSKEQAWAPFVVGRVDAAGPDNTSQLPPQTMGYAQLTCRFLNNGYTAAELVALSGAHSLGFDGAGRQMTASPTVLEGTGQWHGGCSVICLLRLCTAVLRSAALPSAAPSCMMMPGLPPACRLLCYGQQRPGHVPVRQCPDGRPHHRAGPSAAALPGSGPASHCPALGLLPSLGSAACAHAHRHLPACRHPRRLPGCSGCNTLPCRLMREESSAGFTRLQF